MNSTMAPSRRAEVVITTSSCGFIPWSTDDGCAVTRAPRETSTSVIEDVGRRVAELRSERGWTQQEAAEQLAMPLKNFQRIEAGTNLTIRTLVRVALGFEVPTRVLFDSPAKREKRRRGRPRSSEGAGPAQRRSKPRR